MSDKSLRVLFCFGMNQNFFDLPAEGVTPADVWQGTVALIDGMRKLDGLDFIADIDIQGADRQTVHLGLDIDFLDRPDRARADDAVDQRALARRGDDDCRQVLRSLGLRLAGLGFLGEYGGGRKSGDKKSGGA